MLAEILAALKSITLIASALDRLIITIEEKQISDFKKEVNQTLEAIKNAQDDTARMRLVVELSKRLSK